MNKICPLDLISDSPDILTPKGTLVKLINLKFNTPQECRKALKGMSCIYVWYNTKNKKIYIGSAVDLWRRFLSYKLSFEKGEGKVNIRLINAFKLHGSSTIKMGVLEIMDRDKNKLKLREQFYLDHLLPFDEFGYNISKSANRPLNCELSEAGRLRIKERHTGENSEMAKLNDRKVLDIKEKLFLGLTLREIAEEYRVSSTVISNIARSKTWSHIKCSNEIESFLKEKTIRQKQKYVHLIPEIVQLLSKGEKMIDISKKYNIKYTTINNLKIRYLK